MKVNIDTTEWYPVYIISNDEDDKKLFGTSEIPKDKYTEYKRIMKEFDEMQKYLGAQPRNKK